MLAVPPYCPPAGDALCLSGQAPSDNGQGSGAAYRTTVRSAGNSQVNFAIPVLTGSQPPGSLKRTPA